MRDTPLNPDIARAGAACCTHGALMTQADTLTGSDGWLRCCRWCAAAPEFEAYHDREWGFPSPTTRGCSRRSA